MKELFAGVELNDAELAMVVGGADTETTNTASASQVNDKTVVDDSSSGGPDLSNLDAELAKLDRPLTATGYTITSHSNQSLNPLGMIGL